MKKPFYAILLASVLLSVCSCDNPFDDTEKEKEPGIEKEPETGKETKAPKIVIAGLAESTSATAILQLTFDKNDVENTVVHCGCISMDDYNALKNKGAEDVFTAALAVGVKAQVSFPTPADGTASFEGLQSDTRYMAAARVDYAGKSVYSNLFEFATAKMQTGEITLAKEVDLGLSVNWAGWNIGAEAPQEYGSYFAWGETTSWALGWSGLSKYKFYDNRSYSQPQFTKYVTSSSYATDAQYVDGRTTLLPEDDAATCAWGTQWRMPTDTEKTELLANTVHELSEYMGVKGFIFTSKKNGNAIFLPCTGIMMQGSSPSEEGTLCGFWTSTLRDDNSMAYIACNKTSSALVPDGGFEMDPQSVSWHLGQYRWYGLPVRAVTEK